MIITYSGSRLRMETLDKYLWRDVNHIDIKRLWEYLAQYLYLPRLKNPNVLLQAIKEGLASTLVEENFAYAHTWDEAKQRYVGLVVFNATITPSLSKENLIVKPEIANQQLDAQKPVNPPITTNEPSVTRAPSPPHGELPSPSSESTPIKPVLRRFYGSVALEPLRLNRDTPAIANEIIQHLTRLQDANIKITLEIEADLPDGFPDDVVRTVTENCRTLKFNHQSFEQD